MEKQNFSIFKNLKFDIPASITVFLVAVPLCLGIALASGMESNIFTGIIAGIVGGIVVGALSGSALGVSGPAAGLAAIVGMGIKDLGAYDIFLLAVVLAGVFQIIMGFLKLGIIGYYFPTSVIKGMLSGIGIYLFLKQLPHAFGDDQDPFGDDAFWQPNGETTLSEIVLAMGNINIGPFIICIISLGILILFEQKFIKRIKLFNIIQGPLIVVIVGVILNLVFSNIEALALTPEQIVNIPKAKDFNSFVGQFASPDFSAFGNPKVYILAITLAVVASLESLLSLEATDKLDPFKRVSPANRELKAQGVGNLVSGLIGGLPVTQVIVRSSTNIQSGGRTKMSAILHGVILLFAAILIPDVLNLIPYASLAAILFLVAYKLARPSLFKSMYKAGWSMFLPFIVTIVVIVFKDLLWGISLGLVVGIFYILYDNYNKPLKLNRSEDGTIKIKFGEDITFINKASVQHVLDEIPEDSKVIIDLSETINIHHDVIEIIEDFRIHAEYSNIDLTIEDQNLDAVQYTPFKEIKKQMKEINDDN